MGPGELENILIPLAGMLTGLGMAWVLGSTIRFWVQRHYENKRLQSGGPSSAALEQLEDRVAMLEEVAGRVQDIEERLDFTERVLVRQREAGQQLPPGS